MTEFCEFEYSQLHWDIKHSSMAFPQNWHSWLRICGEVVSIQVTAVLSEIVLEQFDQHFNIKDTKDTSI